MSHTVGTNLSHYQLWLDVKEHQLGDFECCTGIPAKKIHPDDEQPGQEYVLVSYTKDVWSVARWAAAFAALKTYFGLESEPKRIVQAMITDDSTVVYYLINNGLVKPRKN